MGIIRIIGVRLVSDFAPFRVGWRTWTDDGGLVARMGSCSGDDDNDVANPF